MVGLDICGMIGFDLGCYQPQEECDQSQEDSIQPWAHITCDGTVANMESVWSTRELKFFAIGIRDAISDANKDV